MRFFLSFPKKWDVFYNTFVNHNGYKEVLTGLQNTLIIAVLGLLIGIVIGTVIAAVKVIPPYKRVTRFFQRIGDIYVAFFRGTPMVVQLLLGYYVLFPMLGINMPVINVCVTIFGLNSGAYISEIMRGGINSVDPGQMEAARSLGLSYWRSMFRVVLPQAIKNMIPSIVNQFIITLKDTSILSVIGFPELVNKAQNVIAITFKSFEMWGIVAVMYLVVILALQQVANALERSLKRDRK